MGEGTLLSKLQEILRQRVACFKSLKIFDKTLYKCIGLLISTLNQQMFAGLLNKQTKCWSPLFT